MVADVGHARHEGAAARGEVVLGAAAYGAVYSHREIGALVYAWIAGRREDDAKCGAVPKGILVVATGRAHAVGTAGVRIIRRTRRVADRRNGQPVRTSAERQMDVQAGNLHLVF